MAINVDLRGKKTKPIQSQFGCPTAENAEGADVFEVACN
jgi:hypothetical protein